MALQVNHGCRDITPPVGVTLSGFVSRCNAPSTGVDDPLQVQALLVERDDERILLFSFDLLGLDRALTEKIHRRLDEQIGDRVPRDHRLFCCTHTHSGPATVTLLGCGTPDPAYWDRLADLTAEAAVEALSRPRPARMREARVAVPGTVFNRRRILIDGRVTMSLHPELPIERVGPVRDEMRLLRFETPAGAPLALIVHWAAHPTLLHDPHISAGYPGELCRRLSERYGLPCLFLQGASANLSVQPDDPAKPGREQMLDIVDRLMERAASAEWSAPMAPEAYELKRRTIMLDYAEMMPADERRELAEALERIPKDGIVPKHPPAVLATILNIRPGDAPPPKPIRHLAASLAEWARRSIDAAGQPSSCELELAVWHLGPTAWCFVAAEVFIETAIALEQSCPERSLAVVGYTGSLAGYLPTDQALAEGGYEADEAFRFYAHPAAFARGSEPAVRHALASML